MGAGQCTARQPADRSDAADNGECDSKCSHCTAFLGGQVGGMKPEYCPDVRVGGHTLSRWNDQRCACPDLFLGSFVDVVMRPVWLFVIRLKRLGTLSLAVLVCSTAELQSIAVEFI